MVLTTGDSVDGYSVSQYLSLVSTEAVMGVEVFREMTAKFKDLMGGRVRGFEKEIRTGKEAVVNEMMDIARKMGADAVIGVAFDVEYFGTGSTSMIMVSASGTAVKLAQQQAVKVEIVQP